jgi:hypothetical protein
MLLQALASRGCGFLRVALSQLHPASGQRILPANGNNHDARTASCAGENFASETIASLMLRFRWTCLVTLPRLCRLLELRHSGIAKHHSSQNGHAGGGPSVQLILPHARLRIRGECRGLFLPSTADSSVVPFVAIPPPPCT